MIGDFLDNFLLPLHQKLLLETPLGRIMACFQHQIVDGSKSWIVMPLFHQSIVCGSKPWMGHAIVSYKNS
ncbi:hypothetical protein [Aliibacillus thermotolerans]|uniref:hypothetical protein n=1 Tax=Aliibacillus thermotolerans TaxID=1834418 RepID=UPI0022EB7BA8|nr:hypothetical protein [Aliibacillus thermotolerans]